MRVGQRIREVLCILSDEGESTYRKVWERMNHLPITNVRQYCQRAVRFGLVRVANPEAPRTYEVVPGWQDRIKSDRSPIAIEKKPAKARCSDWANNPFGL